jgi:hypothetical protein
MQFRSTADGAGTATLDELIARLARNDAVDGILLMGSTGTAALTPTSDYDLLVVLTDLPAPLRMVTTWVGERLTEVYCTTTAALDRVVAEPTTWSGNSEQGGVLSWLMNGRIAFDRFGLLRRSQEAVRQAPPPVPNEREAYEAWRHIGYSVVQMRRYLAATDPASLIAVDLRLLYGLFEVVLAYFAVRGVPWRGEKEAIRYWQERDPAYLGHLRACLAETDRGRKTACYEELAWRALDPVGGLWAAGTTTVAPGAGYGTGEPPPAGTVEDALGFWRELSGDGTG